MIYPAKLHEALKWSIRAEIFPGYDSLSEYFFGKLNDQWDPVWN